MKKYKLLLMSIIALAIILRVTAIILRPLAGDELWILSILDNPLDKIIAGSFADFRPPLFYLLLLPWNQLFGQTSFSLRLFTLLVSLLTLFFLYKIANRFGSKRLTLLILTIAAIAGGYIFDAAEGRMISLGVCLSTAVLWSVIEYLIQKSNKYLWLLLLFLILAAYTYDYLLSLYLSTMVLFLIYQKYRQLTLLTLGYLLALIPFALNFLKYLSFAKTFHQFLSSSPFKIGTAFVSPFIPPELVNFEFHVLTKSSIFFFLLGITCIVIGLTLYRGRKLLTPLINTLWLCYFILPLVLLLLLSVIFRPLVSIHAVTLYSPILVLILARILTRIPILALFFAILLSLNSVYYLIRVVDIKWQTDAYDYVLRQSKPNDLILVDEIFSLLWFKHFQQNANVLAYVPSSFSWVVDDSLKYRLVNESSVNSPRVFLLETTYVDRVNDKRPDIDKFKNLLSSRYTLEESQTFIPFFLEVKVNRYRHRL